MQQEQSAVEIYGMFWIRRLFRLWNAGSRAETVVMKNTEKEIKDFVIRYAIDSVLKSSQCEVKRGRTAEGFIEYAKYVPLKFYESGKVDLPRMIIDYFESDAEHYSEIKKKIVELKNQLLKETGEELDAIHDS